MNVVYSHVFIKGGERKFICGNGNFSLKREHGIGQVVASKTDEDLFGSSVQERRVWGDNSLLVKYQNVKTDVKSEVRFILSTLVITDANNWFL